MSKYLLDTNAWLRIVAQPDKVSQRVKRILVNASNEVFVSHVALWEIAIKRSLGRLELNTYEATLYICLHVFCMNLFRLG